MSVRSPGDKPEVNEASKRALELFHAINALVMGESAQDVADALANHLASICVTRGEMAGHNYQVAVDSVNQVAMDIARCVHINWTPKPKLKGRVN